MKNKFLMVVAIVAASAIIGAATAYGVARTVIADTSSTTAAHSTGSTTTYLTASEYPDLTYAAENSVDAVVSVIKSSEIPLLNLWSGRMTVREQMSGGSGVLISEDGYIVTNHHVAANASKLTVKLPAVGDVGPREYEAQLVGTDPDTEIALIKIEERGLPYLDFGSSDSLRLGEWVLAIGNPYELHSTVTAGIVSAKSRSLGAIRTQSGGGIESFIQTDAAVNPGNSGGALVNTRGELVGINTLIKSPTGSYAGYSFAVPASIVQRVVADLKQFGVAHRAVLGVAYSPSDEGVVVRQVVQGSAAEQAGIVKNDIIVSIDDMPVRDAATLGGIMGLRRPGDKVKIFIKRGAQMKHFDVVLRNSATNE